MKLKEKRGFFIILPVSLTYNSMRIAILWFPEDHATNLRYFAGGTNSGQTFTESTRMTFNKIWENKTSKRFQVFLLLLFVHLLRSHLRELSSDGNQSNSAPPSNIHSLVRNCCIATTGTVVSDLITVVLVAIIPNDTILISVSNLLNVWVGNSVYSLIQGTIPDSFFQIA